MYVCMYVCLSVCVCVCVYVCMYVCVYVCIYILYAHTHTHVSLLLEAAWGRTKGEESYREGTSLVVFNCQGARNRSERAGNESERTLTSSRQSGTSSKIHIWRICSDKAANRKEMSRLSRQTTPKCFYREIILRFKRPGWVCGALYHYQAQRHFVPPLMTLMSSCFHIVSRLDLNIFQIFWDL